jgi:hypothetical protein
MAHHSRDADEPEQGQDTEENDQTEEAKGEGKEVAVKPGRRPPVVTPDTQIGPDVDLDREDVRLRDGTRLTNDLAEAINEDVRRAAGRPSLSGGRQHSPQVSARITPELQAELRKYSKRSGLSPSQVLRHALEQLVGSRLPAGTSKQQAPAKRPRRTSRKDPAGRS